VKQHRLCDISPWGVALGWRQCDARHEIECQGRSKAGHQHRVGQQRIGRCVTGHQHVKGKASELEYGIVCTQAGVCLQSKHQDTYRYHKICAHDSNNAARASYTAAWNQEVERTRETNVSSSVASSFPEVSWRARENTDRFGR
jgi:hypothetical protein